MAERNISRVIKGVTLRGTYSVKDGIDPEHHIWQQINSGCQRFETRVVGLRPVG
jgi:hypothetical protein